MVTANSPRSGGGFSCSISSQQQCSYRALRRCCCDSYVIGFVSLVLAYSIGYYHGGQEQSTTTIFSYDLLSTSSPGSAVTAVTAGRIPVAGTSVTAAQEGWTSLDVYYGKRDIYEAYLLPNAHLQQANSTTANNANSNETKNTEYHNNMDENIRWYSQARQDELVAALLHNPKENFHQQQQSYYFVDLAANDATTLSNTYALERHFGWNGLCIEPNPIYWRNLSLLRDCQLVGAVVGGSSSSSNAADGGSDGDEGQQHSKAAVRPRELESVHFRFEAGDHGGIAGEHFDNGPRWKSRSEPRYIVPLAEILDRYNAPRVIDYLSLDVEGAESFVLRDFPWDRYRFKIVTAERLRGEIRQILNQQGYRHWKKLTRWGETLWIHESAVAELNTHVIEQFGFPMQ